MRRDLSPAKGRLSIVPRKLAHRALLVAVVLCSGILASQQQPIALKGGKLLTVSHGVIDNGVLVMESGKINALGTTSSVKLPKNARVIDVTGMTIYPGLIDSETALGLTEISAEASTNDRIELTDEIMPHRN
jgi:imidazolonepropionase-like amidohydrolase